MVIHIKKDFDYRIVYDKKDELIDCINMAYISCLKKNLSIFGVKAKELNKFTTSEKDVEKGKNWMPDPSFKLSVKYVLNDSMSESDSDEEWKVPPKTKYEESKRIRQAKSNITNESMKFDIE